MKKFYLIDDEENMQVFDTIEQVKPAVDQLVLEGQDLSRCRLFEGLLLELKK